MIKLGRMRLAGHVERIEIMINAYNILVGKPERKGPLGRPRRLQNLSYGIKVGRCGLDSSGSR
jgi:hypothetical protein